MLLGPRRPAIQGAAAAAAVSSQLSPVLAPRRFALMYTCSGWSAAMIAAAPELVLGPELWVPSIEIGAEAQGHAAKVDAFLSGVARLSASPISRLRLSSNCEPRDLREVRVALQQASASGRARRQPHSASSPDRTLQGSVILGALALLPTSLRELRLHVPCSGPLLTALTRFSQLQTLHIPGDGGLVNWRAPGAAAVLPKLRSLRLESWDEAAISDEGTVADIPPSTLPAGIACALWCHATALSSLELHACWSDDLPALVRALPALRQLRLEIMECTTAVAEEAAALLAELPAGTSVVLAVHTPHPWMDAWEHDETRLPPLAAMAATLVRMRLVGTVCLPPDWHLLTGLQSLLVLHDKDAEQKWGTEPLTALTALKELSFCSPMRPPDPALLATAPALAEVCVFGDAPARDWHMQLAALRPTLSISNY